MGLEEEVALSSLGNFQLVEQLSVHRTTSKFFVSHWSHSCSCNK